MAAVHCPRCRGELWDNRAKKSQDPEWESSPDFVCKDRQGCGWRGRYDQGQGGWVEEPRQAGGGGRGPRRSGGGAPSRSNHPSTPTTFANEVRRYGSCVEAIRWAYDDNLQDEAALVAAVATLFIGTKGLAPPKKAAPPQSAPVPPSAPSGGYEEFPEALEGQDDDLPF